MWDQNALVAGRNGPEGPCHTDGPGDPSHQEARFTMLSLALAPTSDSVHTGDRCVIQTEPG